MPDGQQEKQNNLRDLVSAARFDFRGGMSRTRRQGPTQFYHGLNIRPKIDGTLEVRGGQTLYASVGAASGSLRAIKARYTTNLGLKIYSVKREDDITDKIYDGTAELTGTTFKASAHVDTDVYKETIFFSNGENPINYHIPGTSVVAEVTGSPTPPVGPTMVIYKDKMFIGLLDGTIHWTNTGVYETLPTLFTNELNFHILGSEGNGITKLVAGQDFVLAFTDESYHVMTGLPGDDGDAGDMTWQSFPGIGILNPKHATTSQDKSYFIGSDKRIYSFQGTILTDLDPHDLIKEYLDTITPATQEYVGTFYNENELWIYIPQAQNPSTGIVLVYLESMRTWVKFDNINGFVFTRAIELDRYFVGSAGSGDIWEQEISISDLGSDIDIEFVGRQEPLGSFWKNKTYELCVLQADLFPGDSVNAYYSIGNANSFTEFDSGSPIAIASAPLWGAENWGVSAWGSELANEDGSVLTTTFLKFGASTIKSREFRLKITGSVKAKTRILGYTLLGDPQLRED